MTANYGEAVSLAYDPIEKKPLYHFYPGTTIASSGPNGCNLFCKNCQNWQISQQKVQTEYVSPEDMVQLAADQKSIGLAFTYTEPTIWYEYIMDVAPLLRSKGLKVVLVSNGYINEKPLSQLLPLVDAVNIDLKSIRNSFYKQVCKGNLKTVQSTIEVSVKAGIHVEITNLLIPGLNDSDKELHDLSEYVASVSRSIPLHISAYHPSYKMDHPATDAETMVKAWNICRESLDFVYLGNVHLSGYGDTVCPACATTLIKRSGYNVQVTNLVDGKCLQCGHKTGIVH